MRPRGEIRKALSDAAKELAAEAQRAAAQGTVTEVRLPTWRDMAHRAMVGLNVGRRTVVNMAKAGELMPMGTRRVEHSCRPMVTYAPGPERVCGGAPALELVVRSWGR